jgi:type I restriction enzyme S subunit
MKLGPYPEYRDSGIPWLGEIPAHWNVERAKWLFTRMNRPFEPAHETVTCFRDGVVTLRKNRRTQGFTESLQEIGYQGVSEGDLVIHAMDAFAGAVGVSDSDGKCSPVYAVCEPRGDADSRYYARVIKEMARTGWITALARGIRERSTDFRYDDFAGQTVPNPPVEEQDCIEDFLARSEQITRRLISTKLRLIELLKEQKQATIYRTVTRGLDSDVLMKATGLDWLPEVPERWDTRKLKYLTRFDNGIAFKPGDWKNSGVPIIRIQNLNGANDFNYTDRTDLPERLLIQPGDLLFSWSGNRGTSFGPFLWDRSFPAYLNQHIFKVSGHPLHERFFYYALRAVTTHIEEQTHGIIGLVHITKPELGAISVPIPPPNEQEAIACYLDGATEYIEKTIQRARREIELIREYRTRLVSDVVTGKLDVRRVELPEPGETSVEASLDGLESVVAEGIPDTEEVPDASI